jgi:hypothetical protein
MRERVRVRGLVACALMALLSTSCKLGLPEGPEEAGQGVITGRITEGATSTNVANAAIAIRGTESHDIVSSTGFYAMDGLAPGVYTVTVIPPSGFELAAGTEATAPVQVAGSETKTVNFQLQRVVTTTSVPPQARD